MLAVGSDLFFHICGYTSVLIVPGVEGDTAIFSLPEYRDISLTLNIAISYNQLQGVLIYGGCMWAVNVMFVGPFIVNQCQ